MRLMPSTFKRECKECKGGKEDVVIGHRSGATLAFPVDSVMSGETVRGQVLNPTPYIIDLLVTEQNYDDRHTSISRYIYGDSQCGGYRWLTPSNHNPQHSQPTSNRMTFSKASYPRRILCLIMTAISGTATGTSCLPMGSKTRDVCH